MAGFGTRFLPITKSIPKEMLPIVDKPVLQYAVEEATKAGIEEIILITSKGKDAMIDHFDKHPELDELVQAKNNQTQIEHLNQLTQVANIVSIRQKSFRGLGDAIYQAKGVVGDEPFAVILPDDLFYSTKQTAISQLMTVFESSSQSVVALEEVPDDMISSYGVASFTEKRDNIIKIDSLVEKPPREKAPSNFGILGRYIFKNEIFEYIKNTDPDKNGEIQLTTALNSMLTEHPLLGVTLDGTRYDIGNKFGFVKATIEFGLRHQETKESLLEYLRSNSWKSKL